MTQKFIANNYDEVVENKYGIIARNKIDFEYSKFSFFNINEDFLFEITAMDNSGIFPFVFEKNYVTNQIEDINYHLDGTKFNENGTIYMLTNNVNYVLLDNNKHYILYDLINKKAVNNTKHSYEQIESKIIELNRQINNKYINLFADELSVEMRKELMKASLNEKEVLYIQANLKKAIQNIRKTFLTENEFIAYKNGISYPEMCSQQLEDIIESFNAKLFNWINDDYFGIDYVINDNKLNIVLYERNLPLAQDIKAELKNREVAQGNTFNNYKVKPVFTLNLSTGKTHYHNNLDYECENDNEFSK